MAPARALAVLLAWTVGCGGAAAPDEEASAGDEAVEDEGSAEQGAIDPAVAAAAQEGADREVPRLVLLPMEGVDEAEDGAGHLVGGANAVAFELDARLVPLRGDTDPLRLLVGDLVLSRPHTPRPGILRFVLADRDRVREGAAVTLQYGDDEATQVVVDPVLHLPW